MLMEYSDVSHSSETLQHPGCCSSDTELQQQFSSNDSRGGSSVIDDSDMNTVVTLSQQHSAFVTLFIFCCLNQDTGQINPFMEI